MPEYGQCAQGREQSVYRLALIFPKDFKMYTDKV